MNHQYSQKRRQLAGESQLARQSLCAFSFPDRIPGAQTQVKDFVNALYNDDDVIEIRPIECWTSNGKKRSRIISEKRRWFTTDECVREFGTLHKTNTRGANIFMGVNPRQSTSGTKASVRCCRSVWADFDDVALDTVQTRWADLLPPPSMLVSSGHGVHAYWLLSQAFDVRRHLHRDRFEAMLKALYVDLGADATNDVSRILRFPGTWNVKGLREGLMPEPCVLIHCDPELKYPLSTFRPWFRKAAEHRSDVRPPIIDGDVSQEPQAIAPIVRRLDENATDRSRRDFAVICELLRAGLDAESIWNLVRDHSKFASRGRDYFDITINNANRCLQQ